MAAVLLNKQVCNRLAFLCIKLRWISKPVSCKIMYVDRVVACMDSQVNDN